MQGRSQPSGLQSAARTATPLSGVRLPAFEASRGARAKKVHLPPPPGPVSKRICRPAPRNAAVVADALAALLRADAVDVAEAPLRLHAALVADAVAVLLQRCSHNAASGAPHYSPCTWTWAGAVLQSGRGGVRVQVSLPRAPKSGLSKPRGVRRFPSSWACQKHPDNRDARSQGRARAHVFRTPRAFVLMLLARFAYLRVLCVSCRCARMCSRARTRPQSRSGLLQNRPSIPVGSRGTTSPAADPPGRSRPGPKQRNAGRIPDIHARAPRQKWGGQVPHYRACAASGVAAARRLCLGRPRVPETKEFPNRLCGSCGGHALLFYGSSGSRRMIPSALWRARVRKARRHVRSRRGGFERDRLGSDARSTKSTSPGPGLRSRPRPRPGS